VAKIIVFGANGFIGKHLTLSLAARPNDTVIALISSASIELGRVMNLMTHENIVVVPGDFFNREDVRLALEGADYVFHLVSATTPASSANDPFVDIDTNLRATIELLELCVDAK
jgi:UDP-glucose 4-epimerase